MIAFRDDRLEDGVGKRNPSASMRPGVSLLNGEGRVEQQDAVLPSGRERNAFVVLEVPEDGPERTWGRHRIGHRECEPVRFMRARVGVLSQDHYSHLAKWRQLERPVYVLALGTHFARVVDVRHQRLQHVCVVPAAAKCPSPTIGKFGRIRSVCHLPIINQRLIASLGARTDGVRQAAKWGSRNTMKSPGNGQVRVTDRGACRGDRNSHTEGALC